MLYVFYGDDDFRAREALRALRSRLDSDGNLANNTVWLEARGLKAADLRGACQTFSFFSEGRLVIVEGLQERFSGQRRRGARRTATAGDEPSAELDQFLEVLLDLPASTTVVLLDNRSSTALLQALEPVATVEKFEPMRTQELRPWAAARVKQKGGEISPQALERLLTLVDSHHLGEMAQEIDKLIAFAFGRRIEPGDVESLVSRIVEHQFWDVTDAVIGGQAGRALAAAQTMARANQPAQVLFFMLVRQYRQLLLAQAMLKEGLSESEIGAQLGINHPFPRGKLIEQATRYPGDRLEAAYRRLLDADIAVKTGVMDIDTALEMLIVELAELSRLPRGGSLRAKSVG